MAHDRPQRVGQLIQEELGRLNTRGFKDPRIGFITFTGVKVSPDLREAVIYLTGPSGKFITGELLNVDGGGVLWGELWTIPKPAYFTQEQAA